MSFHLLLLSFYRYRIRFYSLFHVFIKISCIEDNEDKRKKEERNNKRATREYVYEKRERKKEKKKKI